MPSFSKALEGIQSATTSLNHTLTQLESADDAPLSVYPRCFLDLSSALASGETYLQALIGSGSSEADVTAQIDLYRGTLVRLQTLLPRLHTKLLCRRVSLVNDCTRLDSLSAWTAMNKTTL